MIHATQSELAGKTVLLDQDFDHPDFKRGEGPLEFRVEDWWDRVAGQSWMHATGNPACIIYAMRTGMSAKKHPTDNEVLYGKIGPFGVLVHVSEVQP